MYMNRPPASRISGLWGANRREIHVIPRTLLCITEYDRRGIFSSLLHLACAHAVQGIACTELSCRCGIISVGDPGTRVWTRFDIGRDNDRDRQANKQANTAPELAFSFIYIHRPLRRRLTVYSDFPWTANLSQWPPSLGRELFCDVLAGLLTYPPGSTTMYVRPATALQSRCRFSALQQRPNPPSTLTEYYSMPTREACSS